MKEKVVISQALIDLMSVVKEQQELLLILLETYPESDQRAAIRASIKRTAAATQRIDANITAAIVAGAKEVKAEPSDIQQAVHQMIRQEILNLSNLDLLEMVIELANTSWVAAQDYDKRRQMFEWAKEELNRRLAGWFEEESR